MAHIYAHVYAHIYKSTLLSVFPLFKIPQNSSCNVFVSNAHLLPWQHLGWLLSDQVNFFYSYRVVIAAYEQKGFDESVRGVYISSLECTSFSYCIHSPLTHPGTRINLIFGGKD